MIFFDTPPMEDLVIPAATKRLTAIGGVIIPIDVLTIIISPSATGLIPRNEQSGSRIGVTSRMIDCVSRKHPRNRSIMLITNSITYLLLKSSRAALQMMFGMFSLVMNHANGADIATTKSTQAALTALSRKIL